MLRTWLRKVENLSDTEENMGFICEPEDGESLGDEEEISTKDNTDCQEGNEERSFEDLIDIIGFLEVPNICIVLQK